jgi:predicted GNAT family acetyltransferase
MKAEFENIELIKTDKRFELTVNEHTAFIDYAVKGDKIALIHTEAPEELAGTGAAAALVEKTLIWLEENNVPLIPLCPYVRKFLVRNPDWQRIVPEPYKSKLS